MKKLTLLPLILCMGSVALAGCTIGGSSNSKKKKSSSQSTGLTTDTSGESSESSGSGSSGSSTSGSSGSSSSAPTEYTPELVANDFNDNLKAEGYDDACVEWDDEYEEYSAGTLIAESTDTSEANLKEACEIVASYLPEYMAQGYAVYGDPTSPDYETIFSDATDIYYYYDEFLSPDEKVVAYFIGYIYELQGTSYSVCQYGISEVSEQSNS